MIDHCVGLNYYFKSFLSSGTFGSRVTMCNYATTFIENISPVNISIVFTECSETYLVKG